MPAPIRLEGSIPSRSTTPADPVAGDALSKLVAAGDIKAVREHFDEAFWKGRPEKAGWPHLKIALLREDRPMLRLLQTWGAAPTDDDMLKFRAATNEKYPGHVRALRAAGLRPAGTPWEYLQPEEPALPSEEIASRAYDIYRANGYIPGRDVENWLKAEESLKAERRAARDRENIAEEIWCASVVTRKNAAQMQEKLPAEWRGLLRVFQEAGAPEAVLAGGALRDLFNNRAAGPVDLFLRARGDTRSNEKFLKTALKAARIETAAPERLGQKILNEDRPARKRLQESWKITTGSKTARSKTVCNIIFVDDPDNARRAEAAPPLNRRTVFADGVLEAFDMALNQIVSNGTYVVSTPAYRDDVSNKRISLLRPGAEAAGELRRLVAKYEDWQLNTGARQALDAPPPLRVSNRMDRQRG